MGKKKNKANNVYANVSTLDKDFNSSSNTAWWDKYIIEKKEEPYVYKGRLNKTEFPDFIKICKFPQKNLKQYLVREIEKYGYEPIVGDGFIYVRSINCPVLLTAHMDTVHKKPVKDFYENTTEKNGRTVHVISSPEGIGGDDRCGIYMILHILRETDLRPAILFCEDEEIGGVGSDKFCSTGYIEELCDMKFFIELDRTNANDLVFYDDENIDFHIWCENQTGYKENYGSFSDISNLSPMTGISSVNISCGYYNAHTLKEEVVVEEMMDSILITEKLLTAALSKEIEIFDYIEAVNNKLYGWYDDYDRYYGNGYKDYRGTYDYSTKKSPDDVVMMGIIYLVHDTSGYKDDYKEEEEFVSGVTETDCIGQFLMEHPNICWNDVLDYYFY